MQNKQYKVFYLLGILFFYVSNLIAAVPAGYYFYAKNKKQAELKTALHLYAAPLMELDYGGGVGFTWEGFYFTDQKTDGSVVDMYSNVVRNFRGFESVDGMHIEHSFPKSWWGAHNNNAYKDLFHLYPADATTNITKSNLPLGEVVLGTSILDNGVTKIGNNGFGTEYTDKCFEPADEFKGDFARSYFYISTIYQDYSALWASPMLNNNTYPVWKPWALDLLLKWHRQDPVSAKELARIEAVYNIQGNRNPFIDYPNLVDYIWGSDSTKIYPFPEETEAFLLTPRRGTKLDFGVILQGDTKSQFLHLHGVNINTDLQLSLIKNNANFSLTTSAVSIPNALTGIDLTITFTPTTSGFFRDTLLVHGGGLTEPLRIPLKALASSDFITLEPTNVTPVGGKLQWISVPQATDYQLMVYQGDKQAGDLIISSYVEGSSWNKAVELYNGTGRTLNLSNYSIQKQSDGSGPFISTFKLSGTLETNKSLVIVHKSANASLLSISNLQTDSVLQFNGNDAISLMRNGFVIDMVGEANGGASSYWGTDVTLKRKSKVTHPTTVYNPNEWTTYSIDSWSMLGNHVMDLSVAAAEVVKLNVQTGKTTSFEVSDLNPQSTYTYRVIAINTDTNLQAINTSQLHTMSLDKPILMQLTDIQSDKFVANWEEVLFASDYLLNVFEVQGHADTTEVEGFDLVGSTATPLPLGWSGNANAIYTTTTSSGISSPSIQLRNAGEWIQTKNYLQPVSKLTFMYRFVTSVIGSSLIVDGFNNGVKVRIDSIPCKNNSKVYPVYNFNASQNLTAFRFTFNKLPGGNFSIDDLSATYGNQDTVFVYRNLPVALTHAQIEGLKANYQYYYNVRATLGSHESPISESISVTTLISNNIEKNITSDIKLLNASNGIIINGLKGDESIKIYTVTGCCVFHSSAISTQVQIPFKQKGIYIIRIQNNQYTFTEKILK